MLTKIENSNGSFTQIDTRDYRPEPTAAQVAAARAHEQMTRQQVLKEFGWDDAVLEQAFYFKFPDPIGSTYSGLVWVKRTNVFSRTQVEAWRERFRAFSAKVR